ncbi:MAG: hypothetical protein HKL91_03835 [Candidatus Eremiobacteraeota bacterium]|nr:hypothetical protein [Candidatus Eremiobacteraeota bacterium]
MIFFRGLSKRLPSIVGLLLLVYIGTLEFAPHPSRGEQVFRNILMVVGFICAFVLLGGALAVLARVITVRTMAMFRASLLRAAQSTDSQVPRAQKKPGFFSRFAHGVDCYIIDFWDGAFMVYSYAVASAYETYNMLRIHSYYFAAYSFVVFAILSIDAILKLEKQPGFVNRLWFGYFFLAELLLTSCIDGSTPASRPSVVFDVLFFGAFAFAGFYGHYRSRNLSEDIVVRVRTPEA